MKKILVCGVGSLGSNLVFALAPDLRGQHQVSLLDFDQVAERNIQAGTQWFLEEQIGVYKVEALQYNIYHQYGIETNIICEKLTQDNAKKLILGYDLIVDTFDNFDARSVIVEACDGITTCLHIGFNGMTFSIQWNENYKVPSDIIGSKDICELQGASSFVKFVASLGALTVEEFLFNDKKREFVGNKFLVREIG